MLALIARRTASPDKDPGGKAASEGSATATMNEVAGGQVAEAADEAAHPESAREDGDERLRHQCLAMRAAAEDPVMRARCTTL
ncbi:hypothetical protein ACIBH1_48915 [Nonomuraea sp. NPDC050663]|uniref:hypothetical protein n=1 Tax=Nonomuraea sp. NPDC050663 TaxID=3364370 RepID=UPI0037ABCBE9